MIRDELIGKKVKVIESKNDSLKNIEGIIRDETKNLFFIESGGKIRKVAKDQCVFDIEGKTVKGSEITKSPEERLKR